MRVLLTGANGQVGRCVQDLFATTAHQLIAVDRAALDISDAEAVNAAVEQYRPELIINAAAYTAVDKAETEPELAAQINTLGPANLARAAASIDAALIHISTDYVFDGNKTTPYVESDATSPQGAYGQTKLAGEREVQRYCRKHVIVRTAWVFSEYGNNFVKTMLRLGGERDVLNVVDDQIGCPTYSGDIARACLAVCEAQQAGRAQYGVYHYAGDRALSWYDFAGQIFAQATALGVLDKAPQLTAIPTIQYPTPAKRPAYSLLDSGKFARHYALPASDWHAGLRKVVGGLAQR